MRQKVIEDITNFLVKYEGFFHSEKEIQIRLAKYLLDTKNYHDIYVEYYVDKALLLDYPWSNDKKISIDIVVMKDNEYIPIEIKFKTKEDVFPHKLFGHRSNVKLLKQSAKNEGCYSFWKDVKRIEVITNTFNLKYSGLVLFITNDNSYQNIPTEGSQYAPFSIHEGRQVVNGDTLDWDMSRRIIKENRVVNFPGFKLSNSYSISWKEMLIRGHKFLLV